MEGFDDIRENLNKLRQEVKLDLKAVNYTVKDLQPSLNLTHNGVDILKKQFKAGTIEQISENRVVKEGDKYLGTEPERKSRAEYKSRRVYQTG